MSTNNNNGGGINPSSLFTFMSSAVKIFGKKKVGITISEDPESVNYYLLADEANEPLKGSLPFTLESVEKALADIPYPTIDIIVWFPAVYVTNSANSLIKHKIRDLYVTTCIRMNSDGCYITIFGNRATYTPVEIANDYNHSHLNGLSYGYNRNKLFCLGTAHIVTVKSDIASMVTQWDVDEDFQNSFIFKSITYFEELKNMVRIESEEGGPYRKIASFVQKASNPMDKPIPRYYDKSYLTPTGNAKLSFVTNNAQEIIEIYLRNMTIVPYFSKLDSFPELRFNDSKILFELHKLGIYEEQEGYELSLDNPNIVIYSQNSRRSSPGVRPFPSRKYTIPFKGGKVPVKMVNPQVLEENTISVLSPATHSAIKHFMESVLLSEFLVRS